MSKAIRILMTGQSNAIGSFRISYTADEIGDFHENLTNNMTGITDGSRFNRIFSGEQEGIYLFDWYPTYRDEYAELDPVPALGFNIYHPENNPTFYPWTNTAHRMSWDLSLAHAIRDFTGLDVYVVKVAEGGTGIIQNDQVGLPDWASTSSGELWDNLFDQITASNTWASNNDVEFVQDLWCWDQGESNSTTAVETYQAYLAEIYSALKTALNVTDLVAFFREINTTFTQNPVTAQRNFAALYPDYIKTIAIGDKYSFNLFRSSYFIEPADEIHLQETALKKVGEEFGKIYINDRMWLPIKQYFL